MALDQFGVDCVFSEQALSVLDDLHQEWLANASKIDQVDGAAGGLRELSDQRHLCFNVQHVPDINRQSDITVGPRPLPTANDPKRIASLIPACAVSVARIALSMIELCMERFKT